MGPSGPILLRRYNELTGENLLTRLTQFGDIDVSSEQVMGWIDQCQKEIATEAGRVERYTIATVTANIENDLPTDYIALINVLINNVDYSKMSRIIIREDNKIIFPEDLTNVVLIYRTIPGNYNDMKEELEIHPLLHPIVLYYLIAMYYDRESEGEREEFSLANKYSNKFEYQKQRILAKLNNTDSDGPVDTLDDMPKLSRYHHSSLPVEDVDGYV